MSLRFKHNIQGELFFLIQKRLALGFGEPDFLSRKHGRTGFCFITSDLHFYPHSSTEDFGPVNLGKVCRFYNILAEKFDRSFEGIVVYCIEPGLDILANALFLLGSFMVLHFAMSPKEISVILGQLGLSNIGFRATTTRDEKLTVVDCLSGLWLATSKGWLSRNSPNFESYDLSLSAPGSIQQLTPKVVAFSTPAATLALGSGPQILASSLSSIGVVCAVFCSGVDEHCATYLNAIESAGIRCIDLAIATPAPPPAAVERFLAACDSDGQIAVHCGADALSAGRAAALITARLMRGDGPRVAGRDGGAAGRTRVRRSLATKLGSKIWRSSQMPHSRSALSTTCAAAAAAVVVVLGGERGARIDASLSWAAGWGTPAHLWQAFSLDVGEDTGQVFTCQMAGEKIVKLWPAERAKIDESDLRMRDR